MPRRRPPAMTRPVASAQQPPRVSGDSATPPAAATADIFIRLTEVGEDGDRGLYSFEEVAFDNPLASAPVTETTLASILAAPPAAYQLAPGGLRGFLGGSLADGDAPAMELNRWPFMRPGQVVPVRVTPVGAGSLVSFLSSHALPAGGEVNQTLQLLPGGMAGWGFVAAPAPEDLGESAEG